MARFFIDRPIFAWVIAIIIMLAGGLAVLKLPVSMYPEVAPPTLTITAIYPGASATVIEETVTKVIEQHLTGLDGMLYFSSQSYSYGGYATISIVFEPGTDLETIQPHVQNRVQRAMPSLPEQVQRRGVNVSKSGADVLQILGFVSEDGSMEAADVADYVGSSVVDVISRVEGVGVVREYGGKYAMRIWLDPARLHAYRLTVDEIAQAIRAQNAQIALGEMGGAPGVEAQAMTAFVDAGSRLSSAAQFRAIILRGNPDGSQLRLGDVARVELGAESYDFSNRLNARPAAAIGVYLAPGANALRTREAVDKALESMAPDMPAGLRVVVPYDSVPFVKASIRSVISTLLEAIVLVFLVIYLFLQNFRATLIPTIAVPVVLLGTFGILSALGFSVNMLTMFAMVLAIGLLVDDAIVVVENVERIMAEEGLSPLEATRKSMGQITGALVGIGLVLSAVFVPMAFMSGATGVIYRQFSATIVSAMALSVLVAVVITPALCATLLKPVRTGGHQSPPAGALARAFGRFNTGFERTSATYQRGVAGLLARPWRSMALFALLSGAMIVLFMRLPSSFLPTEDQGTLVVLVQGPAGSTLAHTEAALKAVEKHFLEDDPVVDALLTVVGFSYSGMGQNNGQAFIRLKDWSTRGVDDEADKVAERARSALASYPGATFHVLTPAAIPALGTAAGFSFFLRDGIGQGHPALLEAQDRLLALAEASPILAGMRANGLSDMPSLQVNVDAERVAALGLSIDEVNSTLATAWGSRYVDDFNDRGRLKRVYLQADASFRTSPDDFALWSVRNAAGEMVPFSSFASIEWRHSSPRLERINGMPAREILGAAAPGTGSGRAIAEIERLARQLPPGFGIEWTGTALQENGATLQTPLLYTLSLLIVFLCLAALYESWSVPTAVLLVAPLGILGAVLANTFRGMERDIYFQVAMLTTVGLTSKNAILIVEFAKENLEKGAGLIEATMHAVRDRLRPIIMTSLAFGLGVLPLALASGAGSGAQRAIGTGVLGGMVVGTLLGVFFVPLFFVIVQRGFNRTR